MERYVIRKWGLCVGPLAGNRDFCQLGFIRFLFGSHAVAIVTDEDVGGCSAHKAIVEIITRRRDQFFTMRSPSQINSLN